MKDDGIKLQRKDAVAVGDLLPSVLRIMGIDGNLAARAVYDAWDEVTGAAPYTLDKSFVKGTLYCKISSSVLRNQLYFQKDAILEKMNAMLSANGLMAGNKGRFLVRTLILK